MTNKPAFIAYTVVDKGKKTKPFFHRIGAAWATEKGDGFNLHLDSYPSDGTGNIVLMPPKAEEPAAE